MLTTRTKINIGGTATAGKHLMDYHGVVPVYTTTSSVGVCTGTTGRGNKICLIVGEQVPILVGEVGLSYLLWKEIAHIFLNDPCEESRTVAHDARADIIVAEIIGYDACIEMVCRMFNGGTLVDNGNGVASRIRALESNRLSGVIKLPASPTDMIQSIEWAR